MDKYDVRQGKLRQLLASEFHNSQKALATAIDVEPSYVSRLLTTGENRKRIGEDLARQIEEKAKKPKYWMDEDSSQSSPNRIAEPERKEDDGYDLLVGKGASQYIVEFKKLPRPLQIQVSSMVHMMVGELVRASGGKPIPPKGPKSGPKTGSSKERRHDA